MTRLAPGGHPPGAGQLITLVLIGCAAFLVGPMLQTRIMDKAGGSPSMVSAAAPLGDRMDDASMIAEPAAVTR